MNTVLILSPTLSYYILPSRGIHYSPAILQMRKKNLYCIKLVKHFERYLLRQMYFHCSISTDLNPPPLMILSFCDALCIPEPKSLVLCEISSIKFGSKDSTLHMHWAQLHIPLWQNEKINFELQYFVFILHDANCHCNNIVSQADN